MATTGIDVHEHVSLAAHTTLRLGGMARYFVECGHEDAMLSALQFAEERNLRLHLLGGGSNLVFADAGFNGLILKVTSRGVLFSPAGKFVEVTAAAGEPWDDLVARCVAEGLGGIECLSGIPGTVGATPLQNVGAYGQEVGETIDRVHAIERSSKRTVIFPAHECGFEYRASRFKLNDAGRFLITGVVFRLLPDARPVIRYDELHKAIHASPGAAALSTGALALEAVRTAVLTLRRRKGMVVDPDDPDTRSAGSFFMNPLLSQEEYAAFLERCAGAGIPGSPPVFSAGDRVKVAAAWLVERAGFPRGFRAGGAGISTRHALALVNRGGSTQDLIDLAEKIRYTVRERFGISLQSEPEFVQP